MPEKGFEGAKPNPKDHQGEQSQTRKSFKEAKPSPKDHQGEQSPTRKSFKGAKPNPKDHQGELSPTQTLHMPTPELFCRAPAHPWGCTWAHLRMHGDPHGSQ